MEQNEMIVLWIIFGLFAIMSIQFLRGKWSVLIAGYNTASEEEKKQYDEKKICRTMGVCMGIITVLLGLMIITDGALPPVLMITIIVLDIGVTLYFANFRCKK